MKTFARVVLVLLMLSPLQWASAADSMDMLLEKAAADKKLLVAANMDLTEAEAEEFWPIYESHQKDLSEINQRIMKLINSYGTEYVAKTLSEKKAAGLIEEMIAIEQAETDLKRSYIPRLDKVISNIKLARYLQIEGKIRAAVKFEFADSVPLVE